VDERERTPLHYAIKDGNIKIIKHLIEECHADVEAEDNKNLTPLDLALKKGNVEVVKYLNEQCQANAEVKNKDE
jgi:ankyrin repeat protein